MSSFASLPFNTTIGAPSVSVPAMDYGFPVRYNAPELSSSSFDPDPFRARIQNVGSSFVNIEGQLFPILKLYITTSKSLRNPEESRIVSEAIHRIQPGSPLFVYRTKDTMIDTNDVLSDTYAIVDWVGANELFRIRSDQNVSLPFIGVCHSIPDDLNVTMPFSSNGRSVSKILSVAVSGRTRVQNIFGVSASRSAIHFKVNNENGTKQYIPLSILTAPFDVPDNSDDVTTDYVRVGFATYSGSADFHESVVSDENRRVQYFTNMLLDRRTVPLIEIHI